MAGVSRPLFNGISRVPINGMLAMTSSIYIESSYIITTIMIDTILFGAGGGKCFTYLGALKALAEKDKVDLSTIHTWGGVSAGALLATMFYIGMRLPEVTEFLFNIALERLGEPLEEELLFDEYGLNDGKNICCLLTELFTEIVGIPDPSFADLYNHSTQKTLQIQVTNLSQYKLEIFCFDTHPDMSVTTAVRMSTAVPFIFTPVLWNNEYFVDGAVISPVIHPVKKEGALSLCVHAYFRPKDGNPVVISNLVDYAFEVTRCFLFLHDSVPSSEISISLRVEGDILLFPDAETKKELVRMGYDQALAQIEA